MHLIALELEKIIELHSHGLRSIAEEKLMFKPSAHKWSKKELIGHMIDSAQNNIRRFIVAQYENIPAITYSQDNWVRISAYQSYDTSDLIDLWYFLNKHIVFILKNSDSTAGQRTCQAESLQTLEWFAQDYLRHLLHHLHQVLELEPVIYP